MRRRATCNRYSTRNIRNDTRPAINTQQETFHPAFGAAVFIQYLIKVAGVLRIGYSSHKDRCSVHSAFRGLTTQINSFSRIGNSNNHKEMRRCATCNQYSTRSISLHISRLMIKQRCVVDHQQTDPVDKQLEVWCWFWVWNCSGRHASRGADFQSIRDETTRDLQSILNKKQFTWHHGFDTQTITQ